MSTELHTLYMLARSKLGLSSSLHRWVLLRNSLQSTALASTTVAKSNHILEGEDDDDEELSGGGITPVKDDAFMFPDAERLGNVTQTSNSEMEWLDALLEDLCDDDEDEYAADSEDTSNSPIPTEDDDVFTPINSPTSSSDDISQPPSYYPSIVPYRVSIRHSSPVSFAHSKPFDPSPIDSSSAFDAVSRDDLEDSVEPIDNTSDNDSDVQTLPSLDRSSSSLSSALSSVDQSQDISSPVIIYRAKETNGHHFEEDFLPFPFQPNYSYNMC